MKVQIARKPILVLSSALIPLFLTGCFGGGIDPKDDPVQPSGKNEAANADEEGAENNAGLNENAAGNDAGNGGGNAANNNLGANNQNFNAPADKGGKDGEAINNAADEDFLNANDGDPNIGGAANGQANMFGNNPSNNLGKNNGNGLGNNNFGLNTGDMGDGATVNGTGGDILESPDVNKGATDNALAEPAPDNSVLAPVAENPTGPVPKGGRAGSGVVRYVTPGGSKMYDKPNGSTLRNLEQGDHPLVNEEGEWSRTSDGNYVPSASLTPAPIARLKQPKEWR